MRYRRIVALQLGSKRGQTFSSLVHTTQKICMNFRCQPFIFGRLHATKPLEKAVKIRNQINVFG